LLFLSATDRTVQEPYTHHITHHTSHTPPSPLTIHTLNIFTYAHPHFLCASSPHQEKHPVLCTSRACSNLAETMLSNVVRWARSGAHSTSVTLWSRSRMSRRSNWLEFHVRRRRSTHYLLSVEHFFFGSSS